MFGSAIIDVAIGVVFVYLLLSLVVTASQELIETVIKLRAAHLAKGIEKLLGNGKATEFFNHALIKGLSPNQWLGDGTRKPSYIPSRTFAMTLLDMLATAGEQSQRTAAEIRTGISNIQDPALKKSLNVLFDECQRDLAKFEEGLEAWFNGQMERVSGWYKRKAQLISVVLAFVITICLNADIQPRIIKGT